MKFRHQTGFTLTELLLATFIISITVFLVYRLTLMTFGEKGLPIAQMSAQMIQDDLDTSKDVDFWLAASTPVSIKTLANSRKLLSIDFSTQDACLEASLMMSRSNKFFQIETLNAGWLTFDPNTLEGEAKFRHMLTLCQHALESEHPVQMTIIKLNS